MATDRILRGESSLPAALSELLRAPVPDRVWHVPLVPRALVWRVLWPFGRERRSGTRLGLWLTDEYVLLADEKQVRAARRDAVARVRVHRIGRRDREYLAFELSSARMRVPVDRLEGWFDRSEALRSEIDRRQQEWRTRQREAAKSGNGGLQALVSQYAAERDFPGLLHWLDEAMRGFADPQSRAAALEVMEAALWSWPDETRRADPAWYLIDGRFAGAEASWLLPLSRVLVLDRAATLLPDAAAVQAAAATFATVPLTTIEVGGPLCDEAFEVLLAWAAAAKLQRLVLPDATPEQRARL